MQQKKFNKWTIFNKYEVQTENEVKILAEDMQVDASEINENLQTPEETKEIEESVVGDDEIINDNEIDQSIDGNVLPESVTSETQLSEDEGLKAQEDIDKQRMEKVYRKQEEDWINKREKVS